MQSQKIKGIELTIQCLSKVASTKTFKTKKKMISRIFPEVQ